MSRFLVILAAVLLFAGWSMRSNTAQLDFFKIEKEENNLVISWETVQEDDVREFALYRRTSFSNNQFVAIQKAFPAHGTSKLYKHIDDQVYKSALDKVDYRIEVVYTNGLRQVLSTQSINYTSTALRRTWGSLKAMFQ